MSWKRFFLIHLLVSSATSISKVEKKLLEQFVETFKSETSLFDNKTLQDSFNINDQINDFFKRTVEKISPSSENEKNIFKVEYNATLRTQNNDVGVNITETLQNWHYPVEEHTVITDDEYILKVFRMPQKNKHAPVVFLMHGLLASSDGWVVIGPNKSLAFLLHDSGYDVWMGNARGNLHSRRHVFLKPEQPEFWQFSWDEIGRYDLPAMIDQALSQSDVNSLYYIGHSQGTTSFFVMASMRPEYNAKIKLMFALSPVAWMGNVASPLIRMLAPGSFFITKFLSMIGVNEFRPSKIILKVAGGFICKYVAVTSSICSNAMFVAGGFNSERLNATTVPKLLEYFPAGSSTRQFQHYAQLVVSKSFKRFDYGESENKRIYGTAVPPSYDMGLVAAPIALYYCVNDWLAHVDDVRTLANKLPNVFEEYRVLDESFSHMDFMIAENAHKVVYKRIIQTMLTDSIKAFI